MLSSSLINWYWSFSLSIVIKRSIIILLNVLPRARRCHEILLCLVGRTFGSLLITIRYILNIRNLLKTRYLLVLKYMFYMIRKNAVEVSLYHLNLFRCKTHIIVHLGWFLCVLLHLSDCYINNITITTVLLSLYFTLSLFSVCYDTNFWKL